MKDLKKVEIKVGIVSVVGTILLILGIIWGRGYRVSMSAQTIYLRFPNSAGLQISSPVVVNGVKRGVVSSVTNDKGSVLVVATVDNTDDFRKDTRARITILEITGGKKVEIFPGTSDEPFDPKQEIPGETTADFSDLVTYLGEISIKGKKLLSQLDTTLSSTNKLFGDRRFVQQTREAITNASDALRITREIMELNQSNINQTLKNLREITMALKKDYSKYEPQLDTLVRKLNDVSGKTSNLLDNARGSINMLDSALLQINGLLDEIRKGEGLANRLVYDKSLFIRLDTTLTNLSELISLIRYHGVNVNLRLGTRP